MYALHITGQYCCCFFKQKTAYEMRISDWSSDVCSSDLGPVPRKGDRPQFDEADDPVVLGREADREIGIGDLRGQAFVAERRAEEGGEIGRAVKRAEGLGEADRTSVV